MGNKAWKEFERIVAIKVGGQRRGAYTGGSDGGKTDVIHEHLAIECKLLKAPTWGKIQEAVRQADGNRDDEAQVAVAFVRKKGERWQDALVATTLEEFARIAEASGMRVKVEHTED